MFKIFRQLSQNRNALTSIQKRNNSVLIYINGKQVFVPGYYTVMQALRREHVVIPSFCYHERLSIAGNCRMCLVHIEGMWKPQIACAVQVAKGMKIRTNTEVAMRAQESVLEFILADHPLDCPICDQGGECDLQDLTMRFGNDRSRFTDIHFMGKRAVEDKNLGPLIRTCMNRCIHCTRCIRFGAQIAGIEVLGTTGRGHDMLVGTFVDKMFLSELSGNIIDLCPVGSLTSGPYMFKARPWELKRTHSIDVTDATGTNIEIDYRFDRVLRILPREHDEINQEWVSDKGRWAVDSTEMQRLVTPMYFNGCCLAPCEWDCALSTASCIIKSSGGDIAAIAGPHTNAETLVACKDLLAFLCSDRAYIIDSMNHAYSGCDLRSTYSLNMPMKNIAMADCIVLIGTNPRFEAPILNVWIRQAYRVNDCDIYVVGPKADYNYHVNYLGNTMDCMHMVANVLKMAKKPLVFVGMSMLETSIGGSAFSTILALECYVPDWPVVHVIPQDASFCAALEIGYKPNAICNLTQNPPKVLISLGNDAIFNCWIPPPSCKIIYIGFQGDVGAQRSALVLPGSAYTEAGGTFMNMESRSQYAMPAVTPPGKARYDWKIIRAMAEYCGVRLPYDDVTAMSNRMAQISPALVRHDIFQWKVGYNIMQCVLNCGCSPCAIDIPMKSLKEYYCSDVFSYNSPTMLEARKAAFDYDNSPYAQN